MKECVEILSGLIGGVLLLAWWLGGNVWSEPERVESFFPKGEFFIGTNHFPKWHTVLEQLDDSYFKLDCLWQRCEENAWEQALVKIQRIDHSLPHLDVLSKVNDIVNQTAYASDNALWGKADYWAMPWEFLGKKGDCEDYAIAKYALLKEVGFLPFQMRLLTVKDEQKQLVHTVLAVQLEQEYYILDNQYSEVIKPEAMKHYAPIYSLGEEGWWLHKETL